MTPELWGAEPLPGGGVAIRQWAPAVERLAVALEAGPGAGSVVELAPAGDGFFAAVLAEAGPTSRYRLVLPDGERIPDPLSRWQPEGVHGPSEVVDLAAYRWRAPSPPGWTWAQAIVYELHVGTFTSRGTFAAAAARLDHLAELGVTTLELMPVANFPGRRNWGYDGVQWFAPATAYGPPATLQAFVDAAHARGLAVLLDVVYNHLGPEGNVWPKLAGERFLSSHHRTPWGPALNLDGPDAGPVRRLVLANARYWIDRYRFDGLRLDATHALVDTSPTHLLAELVDELRRLPWPIALVAEDERNERRLVLPRAAGGYGLDAVWADDFHHQVRRLAAGDDEGYFADVGGTLEELATTLRQGWFYTGQPTRTRGTPRGTRADDLPPTAFVHCLQNHDQVGNRAFGDRIHRAVSPALDRALHALLLVSPYTPLLFQGQEWAASTPFLYFTDHPEPLGRQVTEGRRREFAQFTAFRDPAQRARIPDPQDPATFRRSVLRWGERRRRPHADHLALVRRLLALRRTHPALRCRRRDRFAVAALDARRLALRRASEDDRHHLLFLLDLAGPAAIRGHHPLLTPPPGASWHLLLHTGLEQDPTEPSAALYTATTP